MGYRRKLNKSCEVVAEMRTGRLSPLLWAKSILPCEIPAYERHDNTCMSCPNVENGVLVQLTFY